MRPDDPTAAAHVTDPVPPPPIPPAIAEALRNLIEYNWADEEADWRRDPAENHVFPALQALRAWLTDTTPTVPDIGDRFTYRGRGCVVTSWLKRHPRPGVEDRAVGPDQCPLVFCTRAEAEYVGFSGGILRAADVRVTGHVTWSNDVIDRYRGTNGSLIGYPVI